MNRLLAFLCLCCLYILEASAQDWTDTLRTDSAFIHAVNQTTLSKHRKNLLIKDFLKGKIKDLNDIDTAWISPNYYNYAFMIQNTNTFENFTIRGSGSEAIQRLSFAPDPTFRLGGYFGWRWLFLGYTFDVADLFGQRKSHERKNTEIDLSIYTSKIGVDLYYRKTGNDFKIQDAGQLLSDQVTDFEPHFNGLNIYMKGINVYYIFNHKHFSLPAAYSQSTEQRRSCGSFRLGFSYSFHWVKFDSTQLPVVIQDNMNEAMKFDKVTYSDYNINFGYAYNWVFRRNWLFDIAITPALAYTHSHLKAGERAKILEDLQFKNLNVDLITRVGLVYNNAKYFAGMSFIGHSFNYKKEMFSLNNSFASLNFYVGLNFLRKKAYRDK